MTELSVSGDVEGREEFTFGNDFAGGSFEGGPTIASGNAVLNPTIGFGGTIGAGFGVSANISTTFKENETITQFDFSGAVVGKADVKVTYSDVTGWETEGALGLGVIYGRSTNLFGLGTIGAAGEASLIGKASTDGTTFLGIEIAVEAGTLTVDGKASIHLGLAGRSGELPPNVGMAGDPYALGLDPDFIGQGYMYGHSYQYGYDPRGSGGNWGYYDLESVDFRRADDIIAERAAAAAAAQERADLANALSPTRTGSESKSDSDDRAGSNSVAINTVNVTANDDGSISTGTTTTTTTVQHGSGGGVDGSTITGAGQPVENHNAVSPTTGIAERSTTDLDGAEAAGAGADFTSTSNEEGDAYTGFNGGSVSGGRPVVLDLGGDGIDISLDFEAAFDVDGDGFREHGAWAAAEDGFLVLDLNANGTRGAGDGVINQQKELVLSEWGAAGATDLEGVATAVDTNGNRLFDTNNDGKLTAADSSFGEFRVWRDLNQDGVSDSGELQTLRAAGITQINLRYDNGTEYADTSDDLAVGVATLKGKASFVMNGKTYAGGVGDLELAFTSNGWRQDDYWWGYNIVAETGEIQSYREYGDTERHFGFGGNDTNWVSVVGNNLENAIYADQKAVSVYIDGAGGNDRLKGGERGGRSGRWVRERYTAWGWWRRHPRGWNGL